jgi:hypothetical protein
MSPHRLTLLVSAALVLAAPALSANAQGMMMGPGMMGSGMMNRMCRPAAVGFVEWRTERLQQLLNLTDAQRPKFDDYKAAAAKAADTMRSACPTSAPLTAPGRMEAAEKRMEAMLQAIKTMRPALDALYATLNTEQKAVLDSGRHRYWRWRDRW